MALVTKGLEGIIANESKLSNVQGLEGKLSYLGYTIDDLVENTSFEEVLYLLHRGQLPNRAELDALTSTLRANRNLPQGIIDFLKASPKDAGPMDVIRTGVSMLGLYDQRGEHQGNHEFHDLNEAFIGTPINQHGGQNGVQKPPHGL